MKSSKLIFKKNPLKTNSVAQKCVIIGSFRKHYPHILKIIDLFNRYNIEVLSPKKSQVLNPSEEFVLFDYDPEGASEKEIEDAVLAKMHQADFVYLVNLEGYIGPSASFEVGYCVAHGIKIFAMEDSNELCAKYLLDIKPPQAVIKSIRT